MESRGISPTERESSTGPESRQEAISTDISGPAGGKKLRERGILILRDIRQAEKSTEMVLEFSGALFTMAV